MKLKITLNKVLFLVFLYPIILFFPSITGQEGFWLTAPYFFVIFLFISLFTIYINQLKIPLNCVTVLLFSLFILSVVNFYTIRYSLPLFFAFYAVFIFVVSSTLRHTDINLNISDYFLYLYLILSIPFLLSPFGYVHQDRFAGFVGSPTIYSGILVVMFTIFSLKLKLSSIKFILTYGLTFFLIYITKTRLLLVFFIVYPFLRELILTNSLLTKKKLFLIFYGVTLFIYPLYNLIIKWFPNILTSRYEGKIDTSFRLRNYLFIQSQEKFFEGNYFEIIFGRGNEYSRNFVHSLMKVDCMPHNDYLRILIDWGVIGLLLFSLLLYKLAVKNSYTLFITLVYMILFYSNMVFNLFLLSTLIIFYFKKEETNKKIC